MRASGSSNNTTFADNSNVAATGNSVNHDAATSNTNSDNINYIHNQNQSVSQPSEILTTIPQSIPQSLATTDSSSSDADHDEIQPKKNSQYSHIGNLNYSSDNDSDSSKEKENNLAYNLDGSIPSMPDWNLTVGPEGYNSDKNPESVGYNSDKNPESVGYNSDNNKDSDSLMANRSPSSRRSRCKEIPARYTSCISNSGKELPVRYTSCISNSSDLETSESSKHSNVSSTVTSFNTPRMRFFDHFSDTSNHNRCSVTGINQLMLDRNLSTFSQNRRIPDTAETRFINTNKNIKFRGSSVNKSFQARDNTHSSLYGILPRPIQNLGESYDSIVNNTVTSTVTPGAASFSSNTSNFSRHSPVNFPTNSQNSNFPNSEKNNLGLSPESNNLDFGLSPGSNNLDFGLSPKSLQILNSYSNNQNQFHQFQYLDFSENINYNTEKANDSSITNDTQQQFQQGISSIYENSIHENQIVDTPCVLEDLHPPMKEISQSIRPSNTVNILPEIELFHNSTLSSKFSPSSSEGKGGQVLLDMLVNLLTTTSTHITQSSDSVNSRNVNLQQLQSSCNIVTGADLLISHPSIGTLKISPVELEKTDNNNSPYGTGNFR